MTSGKPTAPAGLRILLLQNLIHLPTFGGANKANRLLLHQLVRRGHTCEVVAPMTGGNWSIAPEEFPQYLRRRGTTVRQVSEEVVVFDDAGVLVHAVAHPHRLPFHAARRGRQLAPDLVLVPADDPGFVMTNAAFEAVGPDRVICLVHTLVHLPFGPAALVPSEVGTRQLRRAGGVATVSQAAADYIRRWGGIEPAVLRLPTYGSGPFTRHGDPDKGAVTLVNPTAMKGIATFLELADRLPGADFLAVPTWGTTATDRAALVRAPNVAVMDPVDDIDEIFARTRVLVMPSVGYEAFGMTAVEAMLRGVPVVSSDCGGLPEAMLGVPYLLPADQGTDPWVGAVSRLLSDRTHYLEISAQATAAATAYVASLRIEHTEDYLRTQAAAGATRPVYPGAAGGITGVAGRVEKLSDARRLLLARMLTRQVRSPTVDRRGTPGLRLHKIAEGPREPVVMIDLSGPRARTRLSGLFGADRRGYPMYRIDVIGDFGGLESYMDLRSAAEGYRDLIADLPSSRPVMVAECSAARLATEISGRLRSADMVPVTVLVEPSWPNMDSVGDAYRTLREAIPGSSGGEPPRPGGAHPAELLSTLVASLVGEVERSGRAKGWSEAEIVSVTSEVSRRYRGWLGMLIASAAAGPAPDLDHVTVVADEAELGADSTDRDAVLRERIFSAVRRYSRG